MMKKFIYPIFIICLLLGLSCNKEVSVEPQIMPSPDGVLFIQSNPSGAKIYIDGKNTGRLTPDSISWLAQGSYKITLKLEAFKDTNIVQLIKENERTDIFVDYISNPTMRGSILLKTNPVGADIIFKDSLLAGRTPFQLNDLLPGEYKIKFKKSGYWDDSTVVLVRSGQIETADIRLIDSSLWVSYTTKNSGLPSNFINWVLKDNQSNIWIATNDAGLVKYSNNTWTIYNKNNSPIPDNCITRLNLDKYGNLWICTYASGLVKFDGSTYSVLSKENSGLPSNNITAVEFDSLDRMWVGTFDKGVSMYNGTDWIFWNSTNSALPSDYITSIRNFNGQVYVGTPFGLSRYKGKMANITISKQFQTSPSQNVQVIEKDKDLLYVGLGEWGGASGNLPGGTAYMNRLDKWAIFNYQPGKSITCMIFDSLENIWFGTQDNGFAKSSKPFNIKKSFKKYNSPLTTNWVTSITIDKNNYKWIATFGGGLVKYKGD